MFAQILVSYQRCIVWPLIVLFPSPHCPYSLFKISDIKCDNFLVSSTWVVKVADFVSFYLHSWKGKKRGAKVWKKKKKKLICVFFFFFFKKKKYSQGTSRLLNHLDTSGSAKRVSIESDFSVMTLWVLIIRGGWKSFVFYFAEKNISIQQRYRHCSLDSTRGVFVVIYYRILFFFDTPVFLFRLLIPACADSFQSIEKILSGASYGLSADVYSFAITLW